MAAISKPCLSNEFAVHRGEVITTFLKRTIYEPDPLAAKNLLLSVPAEEHRPFWKKIVAPVASIFDFDAGVARFRELVNNLFTLVPAPVPVFVSPGISAPRRLTGYGGYASVNYFPAGIRDVLISAGRTNTLVQLIYDGYTRLVEPYAFEYRVRKKDGAGVEYFWGWDLSGGKSGKTGIKMFISDKIESVSPAGMSFNPRFQVEL